MKMIRCVKISLHLTINKCGHIETISKSQTQYPVCPSLLCTHYRHLLLMELKRVLMFSVGWLATHPEEPQSVLPGSLWGCLTSGLYHRTLPTRFQLGRGQGTLQASPSHQSQHQLGILANSFSIWASVVMLKHLYLWMVLHEWRHLLLQDFVPVLHFIEVPLDHNKISTVLSRHPEPHHERCTPSIPVRLTDAWICQSFVSSFPHCLSSINPLKHKLAFI